MCMGKGRGGAWGSEGDVHGVGKVCACARGCCVDVHVEGKGMRRARPCAASSPSGTRMAKVHSLVLLIGWVSSRGDSAGYAEFWGRVLPSC